MRFTLLLLFFILPFHLILGQPKTPYVQNFTNKVYGKKSNPEIYCVVQDAEKRIIAGTSNGVKIYNGVTWDFVGVKEGSYVTSLARAKDGSIFVGALGDFGELKKKKNGRYYYVSLLGKQKLSEPVWRVHCLNGFTYFQTESAIYCYSKGQLYHTFKPNTTFHLSFQVGNRILVRQRDKGIYELKDKKLKLLNASKRLKENGVFAIFEEKGNLRYFVRDEFSELPFEKSIYGGIQLRDGNYLIYTLNDGAYILSPAFKIINHLTKDKGISDNDIKSAIQGIDGNLWLATNNGLSFIEYQSDLSFYTSKQGVEGDVHDVALFEHHYTIATTKGVFIETDGIYQKTNVTHPCWELFAEQNRIFCATSEGLYMRERSSQFKRILSGNFNNIQRAGNLYYLAGPQGILITNHQFTPIKSYDLPLNQTLGIFHDKKRHEVWVGTTALGVIRINAALAIEIYTDDQDGLNIAWIKPIADHDGNLVFATLDGLQRFVYEEEMKLTLPDSLRDDPNFYRGTFEPLTVKEEISDLFSFKGGKFAVVSNEIKVLKNFNITSSPYNYLDFGRINRAKNIQGDVYLCTSDGLVVLEKMAMSQKSVFILSLEKITTDKKRLNLDQEYELSYQENNLNVFFQAPLYLHGTQTSYTYWLEGGQSTTWSAPIKDNHISLNNLGEGTYTLHILAKNNLGKKSNPISYTFHILPPWYRTNLAYATYMVLLAFFFWLSMYYSSKRLKRKNEELEQIVQERTIEIAHQKDLIEEKHQEITDSINYAERIQAAMMTNSSYWEQISTEHFVLFKPRDIVSGDFYWAYQNKELAIWVAADCTGHGVPGAFMSMLGIGFLNEIVIEGQVTKPAQILAALRTKIIQTLEQKADSNNQRKDGMDMAICCLNKKTKTLSFSGANNPLVLVTKNQQKAEALGDRKMLSQNGYYLVTISGDKMPVGKYVDDEKAFTEHEIAIENGDVCYTFSDGFQDQFGGYDGKKFMIKRLKQLFLNQIEHKLSVQKTQLEQAFDEWIKTGHTEQIDDVCMIGIKIELK